MKKIKMVIVQAREGFKPGETVEVTAADAAVLMADGVAITEAQHMAENKIVQAREAKVDGAIAQAKERGALAPQENTDELRKDALVMEQTREGMGVRFISNLPVKASQPPTAPKITGEDRIEVGTVGVRELVKGYIQANEPFSKELRNGGIVRAARGDQKRMRDAQDISVKKSLIMSDICKAIDGGADFRLADVVRAADYADPAANNPLGVLNTGLTLQWNLGFLKYQLAMLNDITTDIQNQPVLFQQVVRTRYINVPGVQLKATGVAWAPTTGSAVDVNVSVDTYAGVPIAFSNNVMSATARQLHNEMKTPQMDGLGRYVIYKLVNNIFAGNTRIANDGVTTSTIKFGKVADGGTANGVDPFTISGATLATFTADLPAAMDEALFPGGDEPPGAPDVQRFAWVQTRVYANLAADTNYMLNQSIWGAAANKGGNLLETGRFNRVGNINITKSQLITNNVAATSDGGSPANYTVSAGSYAAATHLGFAGTRSSLLFVSRVPLDYTQGLPEIPSTAAIELVTEPSTGLTFMVVKFLDHAYETSNMRVALMFGTGIGDERQGMLLKK